MRYQFDEFEFDPGGLQLTGPDGDVPLRPMTVRLLLALIEEAPQLLRHDELLDRVWGRQAVTQGVLAQSIRELRQALGDSVQKPRYIETKHRLGYRFIAEVRVSLDQAMSPAEPAVAASAGVAPGNPPRPASTAAWPGIVVVLVLLIGAALLWLQPWTSRDANPTRALELVQGGRPEEPQALAWYQQGLEALRRRDLGAAKQRFEQSLKREPDAIASMAALADTLAQAGDRNAAQQWTEAALRGVGSLPRSEQLRLEAFAARLDYRRTDEIGKLQALFQLDQGDVDAGLRLAAAQIDAGRSADAAVTLDRIDALDTPAKDPARVAMMRAKLATSRGDHSARLRASQQAEAMATHDQQRADALLEQAWALALLGQTDAANDALGRVDELLEKTPLPPASLRRHMLYGTLQREDGKYDEAIDRFESAATIADQLGQRSAAAVARREMAYVRVMTGEIELAATSLDSLIVELEEMGDPRELASTLDVASVAQQHAGNVEKAKALGIRAMETYIRVGDTAGEAATRVNLGMLFGNQGRLEEAADHFERAATLFGENGNLRGKSVAQSNLAVAYGATGRAEAARALNESALEGFREVGAIADIARTQFNLGVQDRRAGNLVSAESRMREALDGVTRIGAHDFRHQIAATFAELLLLRADIAGAQAILASLDTSDEADGSAPSPTPARLAAIETARGRYAALTGALETARTQFTHARELRSTAGMTGAVLGSELDLAELVAQRGNLVAAEQAARELRRQLLEAKDAPAAIQAGLLLAGTLAAQGFSGNASRLVDQLESELEAAPDRLSSLRLDLVRAALRGEQRGEALLQVAAQAREVGFELLALRAELLSNTTDAGEARSKLEQRGILVEGMPPPLPY
ncbi:MAG: tetratricopeptide repeat protein [Lysobacteraceae bacterium]